MIIIFTHAVVNFVRNLAIKTIKYMFGDVLCLYDVNLAYFLKLKSLS